MTMRNVTRQELIAAILECTEKLGGVPTIPELKKSTGIDRVEIRKHFGNYKDALKECNLEVPERGRKLEIGRLFRDWVEVVRKLKKLPTVFEYEENGSYSEKPLSTRFGAWSQVPGALKLYAEKHGLAGEWRDVMELIEGQGRRASGGLAGRSGGGATLSAMVLGGERREPARLWGGDWKVRARLRSDEREWRGVSIWRDGRAVGVYGAEDTDRVSGLRGDTTGWERPLPAGKD